MPQKKQLRIEVYQELTSDIFECHLFTKNKCLQIWISRPVVDALMYEGAFFKRNNKITTGKYYKQ